MNDEKSKICPAICFPFNRPDASQLSPLLLELQDSAPASRVSLPSGQTALLVTGYREVKEVLARREFSCQQAAEDSKTPFIPFFQRYRTLLSLDPPRHTRARRLAANLLGAETAAAMARPFSASARELLERMREKGPPSNLSSSFIEPLVEESIERLTGIPLSLVQELHRLFNANMTVTFPPPDGILSSFDDLDAHLAEIIAERRAVPADDLLSRMLAAAAIAPEVTEDDLVGVLVTVLIAGIRTPGVVLSQGILNLLNRPDQWELLVTRRELIPTAVEEILRYCPPVEVEHLRLTTKEVSVTDTSLPYRYPVLPSIAAANRSSAIFADPNSFDVSRQHNPHLAFGYGPHTCPGTAIARKILSVALEVLADVLPGVRAAAPPGEPNISSGYSSALLSSLHVQW
ncbi:cytochrome P450 [Streptomyces sp. NPDC047028]|uniref:cytochrome P450 n=1 Tax=Streptomyces sp. NPDC047028 TaxID=3155793 RepID=UPI0033C64C34